MRGTATELTTPYPLAGLLPAVLQEDAHVLGLSSLSGAHLEYARELVELMRANGLEDVLFVVGGTIPDADAAELKELGVSEVFGPGTHTDHVIDFSGTIASQVQIDLPGALSPLAKHVWAVPMPSTYWDDTGDVVVVAPPTYAGGVDPGNSNAP